MAQHDSRRLGPCLAPALGASTTQSSVRVGDVECSTTACVRSTQPLTLQHNSGWLCVSARAPSFVNSAARQRHEIHSLREQQRALCAALEQLQQRHALLSRSHAVAPLDTGGCDTYWHRTAERERSRLKRARCTNARLRQDVLANEQTIKRMHVLVRQRIETHMSLSSTSGSIAPSCLDSPRVLTTDDRSLLSRAVASLERMRQSARSVLATRLDASPATSSSSTSYRKWSVGFGSFESDSSSSSETEPLRFEVLTCDDVPFQMREVERALQQLQRQHEPNRCAHRAEDFGGSSANTTVHKEQSCFTSSAGAGIKRSHVAYRLCVGASHSLVVATAFVSLTHKAVNTSTDADTDSDTDTIKYEVWTLLTPIADTNQHTGHVEHSTRIQSFAVMWPVATSMARTHGWGRDVFETAVQPQWSAALTTHQQRLENILVDNQATV